MVLAMTNEVCQRSVSGYTMTRQALTMSSLLKASTTPVTVGMAGDGDGGGTGGDDDDVVGDGKKDDGI